MYVLPNRQLRKLIEQMREEFAASQIREKEFHKLTEQLRAEKLKFRLLVTLIEEVLLKSQH
jgi:hypothetical protein